MLTHFLNHSLRNSCESLVYYFLDYTLLFFKYIMIYRAYLQNIYNMEHGVFSFVTLGVRVLDEMGARVQECLKIVLTWILQDSYLIINELMIVRLSFLCRKYFEMVIQNTQSHYGYLEQLESCYGS